MKIVWAKTRRELGLGIHGEPGVEQIALQATLVLVETMADRLRRRLDAGGAAMRC